MTCFPSDGLFFLVDYLANVIYNIGKLASLNDDNRQNDNDDLKCFMGCEGN